MIKDTQIPVKITLKELVMHYENFLDDCSRNSSETRGTYQRALREFVKWYPIDKRFSFLTRDVERYKRHLIEVRGLKNISISTYISSLRRFFQYLIDVKVITFNPATRVIGGRRPVSHSRTFLTPIELDKLFTAIDISNEQGLRDFAIMKLMCECGLTEHEILQINVGDLNQVNRYNSIYVQGKGRKVKDTIVELSKEIVKFINDYLEKRYKGNEDKKLETDPLFISLSTRSKGERMSSRGIREAISRRLIDSGVKNNREHQLTPFSLRHSSGVKLVEQGATVEELMKKMRLEWRPSALLYFKLLGVNPNKENKKK
ncbi:MAG: tyrosine-type recombinase/integrase [Chlorobiota bacterium]|jgi:site-specific recombinase XerD|nr:tyrosine-type recombinase/integrase [Chlorobiota bacterium]QQS66204.1 MAG: tyrosine-type recombinase/integrase [Chlorobiota bacterium]